MAIKMHLVRPDSLYFCWKKAVNSLFDPSIDLWPNGPDHKRISDKIEQDYGCRTVIVHRVNGGYVSSVEVEFLSEEHITWFKLRWS